MVYGTVKELSKSVDAIEVEILLPAAYTSDSTQFTARFEFFPQKEIRYEVTNGYGKGSREEDVFTYLMVHDLNLRADLLL